MSVSAPASVSASVSVPLVRWCVGVGVVHDEKYGKVVEVVVVIVTVARTLTLCDDAQARSWTAVGRGRLRS